MSRSHQELNVVRTHQIICNTSIYPSHYYETFCSFSMGIITDLVQADIFLLVR